MATSPRELLEWASIVLDGDESGEVCARACASRAYYSAYHSIAWIGGRLSTAPDDRRGLHDQLCWKLQSAPRPPELESFHLKLRGIGYRLQQQKDVRVKADYHLDHDFSEHEAQEAILVAEKVRDEIDEIEASVSR